MLGPITFEQLGYALGILGILFGAYEHFKKPSEKTTLQLNTLEQKFVGEQKIMEQLANLRDNHIHTLESKLDGHLARYDADRHNLNTELTRISTILDERLPSKKHKHKL